MKKKSGSKKYTVTFQQRGDYESYSTSFVAAAGLSDEQIELKAVEAMYEQGETWSANEITKVRIDDLET